MGKAQDRLGPGKVRVQGHRFLGRLQGLAQFAEGLLHLGQPGPGQGVVRLGLNRFLQAFQGPVEIEVGLLGIGQGDQSRSGIGVGLYGLFGQGQRFLLSILGHGDGGLQGQGIAVVRGSFQGLLKILAGFIDPAHGQQQGGPIVEEARVVGLFRGPGQAFKGPGQIPLAVGFQGFLYHFLFRPGKTLEVGGAVGQDRWVVEGPLDGVAGPDYRARDRRPAGFGHGRLTAGNGQAAGLVRGQHFPFKYRNESTVFIHPHEKFRAFHTGVDEGRGNREAPGRPAEEMGGPFGQIHQRGFFLLHPPQGQGGILIEAEDRLVGQGQVRPAPVLHSDSIPRAIGFIQLDRLPLGPAFAFHLNGALDGDHFGHPLLAGLGPGGRRGQQYQTHTHQKNEQQKSG